MLRTRLMLGLACLWLILLSMGLYSINRCSDLGHRLEAVNRDNDESGRAFQQMKRSGASMSGALLFRVTGEMDQSRQDFTAASGSFRAALAEVKNRDQDFVDEKRLLPKVDETYEAFSKKAQAFIDTADTSDVSRTAASVLGHKNYELLDMVDQLALAHQKGVRENGRDPAADINDTIAALLLLMLGASVVAIYASLRLSRGLLQPLSSLAASIQQVGEGNLDQTVPVLSHDELGQLATSFNQMATQLKQYRANTSVELLRLNMTIRATLASFPDPIFVLNSEGAIDFRNPEADHLAMQLLFSGVRRLPSVVDEKVEHVRATGQDFLPMLFSEAIKFHLNGQDRYFLPRIVLLRDDRQEVFGVAVILEDVTRMLLLDDVKSNLISTVSHELKTPLTSVRMALYLLVEKTVGSLNDKQLDLVLTAREDADRLLRTLNDLLDLAKLEHGPDLLDLVPVTPRELVETAVHSTREVAHAAGVDVEMETAVSLPKVKIDRQRIAYVFANLITNAIKYSPAGTKVGVRADIGETRAGRACVRFSVKDEGPGISPEHQAHIFERFYRVPGTNKSGAGLGLSIAREIVAAHEGEIGVISEPSKGSEFFFVIPALEGTTE